MIVTIIRIAHHYQPSFERLPERPALCQQAPALYPKERGLCVNLALRQRRELARHAGFDSLTNPPNRRLFDDRMEQAFRRHSRHAGAPIAALLIDLDGFKLINDRDGHKAGDRVLRPIAARRALRRQPGTDRPAQVQ